MTAHAPDHQINGLDGYVEAMADTPLLGHLVFYSIFTGRVTRDNLERWFLELGLDPGFVPPQIRPVDAYEKVTGDVKHTYPLDDQPAAPRRRRQRRGQIREATLMVRHVSRDNDKIVRHLVREVRDGRETRLSYDVRFGEIVFRRDSAPEAAHGAGSIQVTPDYAEIQALPEAEQAQVHTVLDDITNKYRLNCTYLTSDRLRSVLRSYIEHLNAIRVRPTGGVYFVHRRHSGALAALRELVRRFGGGSHLVRVPLPDQEEMQEMVIAAFTSRAKDDLDKLARDIADAQQAGETGQANALYKRFQSLEAATAEHSDLLSTNLDDTKASLDLVKLQLGALLAQAD